MKVMFRRKGFYLGIIICNILTLIAMIFGIEFYFFYISFTTLLSIAILRHYGKHFVNS